MTCRGPTVRQRTRDCSSPASGLNVPMPPESLRQSTSREGRGARRPAPTGRSRYGCRSSGSHRALRAHGSSHRRHLALARCPPFGPPSAERTAPWHRNHRQLPPLPVRAIDEISAVEIANSPTPRRAQRRAFRPHPPTTLSALLSRAGFGEPLPSLRRLIRPPGMGPFYSEPSWPGVPAVLLTTVSWPTDRTAPQELGGAVVWVCGDPAPKTGDTVRVPWSHTLPWKLTVSWL